jgi:hypothetical protein
MERQQLRANQLITTFGPGAMVDLPHSSVIVAGLDHWKYDPAQPQLVEEPRLALKVGRLVGKKTVTLRRPPPTTENLFARGAVTPGVEAYVFPHWFIAQYVELSPDKQKRRRLVYREELVNGRIRIDDKNRSVVPVRFVRACRRGHVGDVDWRRFAHNNADNTCMSRLWMEERGTTGDLSDIWIICECGAIRSLREAAPEKALGICNGTRPWLDDRDPEPCKEQNRLLIRTASNAYFPQVMSVISIPDSLSKVEEIVLANWDGYLNTIQSLEQLTMIRGMVPALQSLLQGFSDEEIFGVMELVRKGEGISALAKPVKEVEFEKLSAATNARAGDEPIGDFYTRLLDRSQWEDPLLESLDKVVLVHKLREVAALVGFTRFEVSSADTTGELDLEVKRAHISNDQSWFPVSENRGEGVFLQFNAGKIQEWLERPEVQERSRVLEDSFDRWLKHHPSSGAKFPGAPYIMIHSLSHLLICAISLECGYPLSSLRERIYAPVTGDAALKDCYGILIYTSSSGAEGTLGSLVHASRKIRRHMKKALQSGTLCSNDPVCSSTVSNHDASQKIAGSACHGCLFISETSCERFNESLDRALVVPTIDCKDAAFFSI